MQFKKVLVPKNCTFWIIVTNLDVWQVGATSVKIYGGGNAKLHFEFYQFLSRLVCKCQFFQSAFKIPYRITVLKDATK
jgi:hypothetical protein